MNNETDLDWLARNVHEWPYGMREVLVCYPRNVDTLIWSCVLSNTGWITKEQWLTRRAELQKKPSWCLSGSWSKYLAQDMDGEWKWLGENPSLGDEYWTADELRSQCKGVVIGDWRDTLEKRPADLSEQAVTARLKEATDNVIAAAPELMSDKYKFEPFVSVEDAATEKQSELEMLAKVSHLISDKRHRITSSKYTKTIHGVSVDVYDVLQAWGVSNPALQHLIKKALQCGQRGHKDNAQDLQDIIDSAIRAKELG